LFRFVLPPPVHLTKRRCDCALPCTLADRLAPDADSARQISARRQRWRAHRRARKYSSEVVELRDLAQTEAGGFVRLFVGPPGVGGAN
jgi:hypothetical protein